MAPYAWEVEKENAEKRLAGEQGHEVNVASGKPAMSGLAGQPLAQGAQTAQQATGTAAVRTDADGKVAFATGDTVRLKGGKGSTMKVESIDEDGKVHLTVVGKGATKGAKATYEASELERFED